MIQQFHFWVFTWRKQKHKFKEIYSPHVHCSIIYNSQDTEATYVSTDRWMDKEDVPYIYIIYIPTYTHGGILVTKWEILLFVITCMHLEDIKLSAVSQRETITVWFHLYVQSKKQNQKIKQKENRIRYREQMRGCQREGIWGDEKDEED